MQPSSNFFPFLRAQEGLVLHPYKDITGKPTIGYGSTFYEDGKAVTMNDPSITAERAEELAQHTLKAFITHLNILAPHVNQNQFDALLDFEYNLGWGNLGSSTLLKRVNLGASPELIREAFMMWDEVRENGILKVNDWQQKRRTAEADLFLKPVA